MIEKKKLYYYYKEEHFPTILCYDDCNHTIYMNNCGDRIRKKTKLPENWKKQMSKYFQHWKNIKYIGMIFGMTIFY